MEIASNNGPLFAGDQILLGCDLARLLGDPQQAYRSVHITGTNGKGSTSAMATALLAGGTHHGERVLSRPSVTLMTSDQLTPAQKAVSGFWPGYFDTMGWGFGMSVRTRRTHLGPSVGSYGWPGFYGTAWYNDPAEHMTTIFIMQRAHAGDQRLPMWHDFWTAVYQAIND